ncbi:hypothetical protein SAY87_019196 [Trapa incisa]|uniref:DNA-directed RNA polymerase III subunit RPC4 n=1 Tax=Trapa incisa TaxID=236973 RepID=A0AAN7Q6W8_9MYRT|nr:hypothetical protein SAY87_019196 [Trapa incisa]
MESKPDVGGGAAPRKVRFAPKAPPRKPKPAVVKTEVRDDGNDDDFKAKDLLRHFNEGILKGNAKAERKVAPSQIAFGYGGAAASIKSYGSRSRVINQGTDNAFPREEKEYQEPWDYHSYYPVSVPLRRPYSGNPELLDEQEFGNDLETAAFDENFNSAEELGLTEENLEPSMFFVQLPPSLPVMKPWTSTEGGEERTESSKTPVGGCGFDELPGGFMGKMLVYRSGAIKLKLGDNLYDVSAGSSCVFAQEVVAMNTAEKHCSSVGELTKRVIITPDVDSILDSIDKL